MLDVMVACAAPSCDTRFERLKVTDKYCPGCRKNTNRTRSVRAVRPGEVRCVKCGGIHMPSWDGDNLCHRCAEPSIIGPVRVRAAWPSPSRMHGGGYLYSLLPMTRGQTIWEKRTPELAKYIGVDGEGVDTPEGHKYVLLGCGTDQYENPEGISWHEAFAFLWSCYLKNRDAVFAGFFLGYDFAQLLSTLPASRGAMIYSDAGIESRKREKTVKNGHEFRPPPFPAEVWAPSGQTAADYKGNVLPVTAWQFDLLPPQRRLCIRPRFCQCDPEKGTLCEHVSGQPWMWICDAGPFFQSSLLTAINPRDWREPIVTAEEYALIERGKLHRADAALDDDMRMYNRLENEVLSRLLATIDTGLADMGIGLTVKQWFGPGQAAQEWMRAYNVLDRKVYEKTVPASIRQALREAYYGGRFEVTAHGHVPGITHEYDINSAYPHQISQLPCLMKGHGKWTHGTSAPHKAQNRWILCKVRTRGTDPRLGGLPYRKEGGSIVFPRCTEGWYWLNEINAARNAGLIKEVTWHEWWAYEQHCSCDVPTQKIRDLYQLRLDMGKDTPAGKAAKLIYNSVYGKFAQSKGEPRYGNAMYASLITSECRAQILDAIATHPERSTAVVMIATDAVYFTSQHPAINEGEALGQWDHKEKHNLTLYKPGVYWDDKTRKAIKDKADPKLKSRGIPAKDLARSIEAVDKKFGKWGGKVNPAGNQKVWPDIPLTLSFAVITPRQALARRKWNLAGSILHDDTRQEASWNVTKRNLEKVTCVNGIWFSAPWDGTRWAPSLPYDKFFGDQADNPKAGWDSMKDETLVSIEAPYEVQLREHLDSE